jgi:multimeric flavodoxin WrbA
MKKILAIVGSPRRRNTYRAVERFLEELQALGGVESEIVHLADYRLETCRGCLQCFERGEERCPLKDDRDALIEKIESADGVVFASPNYSLNVSGLMKTLFDRLSFMFHRPRFFGKIATSIVTQGIFGGRKVVEYLDRAAPALGFDVVKGACVTTLEPMSASAQRAFDRALGALARRFHRRLGGNAYPVPTLSRFIPFRMSRTMIRLMLDESRRDYVYYRDRGWFESDYCYPVRLGVLKKIVGGICDAVAGIMARRGQSKASIPAPEGRVP